MRAGVIQPGFAPVAHHAPRGKTQDVNGENQQREHRHFDLEGSDFLAEIFRCAPDHQPGDKHREHDEDEHSVKSRAHAYAVAKNPASTKKTSFPKSPAPTPPKMFSPSWILNRGKSPPSAVKKS